MFVTTKRKDILSQHEVAKMIKSSDKKLGSLIAFMYLTGCRVSEVIRVKRGDIWETEDGIQIRIYPSKKRKLVGGLPVMHILDIGKNELFMDIILDYIKDFNDDDNLWSYSDNKKSSRVLVWQHVKKVNKDAWLHLFRSTRMTNLALAGATSTQLTAWAGWSSIKPSESYIQMSPKMIKKLGRGME